MIFIKGYKHIFIDSLEILNIGFNRKSEPLLWSTLHPFAHFHRHVRFFIKFYRIISKSFPMVIKSY